MATRKHPDKETRDLLAEAADKGWRIEDQGKYWKIMCPNECKCWKTVKCTPSGAYYLNHLRKHLERHTCWRKS